MIRIILTFLALSLITHPVIKADDGPVYVNSFLDALAESEASNKDILVIFTAPWCGACKMLKKDLEYNQSVVNNKIVCYIDYDTNLDLVKEYRVRIIPFSFLMRKRKEVKHKIGYTTFQDYKVWIIKNE